MSFEWEICIRAGMPSKSTCHIIRKYTKRREKRLKKKGRGKQKVREGKGKERENSIGFSVLKYNCLFVRKKKE